MEHNENFVAMHAQCMQGNDPSHTKTPMQRALLTWRQNMKAMATMYKDRDCMLA